jgi:stage V sporulation protein B
VLIVLLNISGINFYAIVIANIICYYLIAMRNISFLQKDFCLKINFKTFFVLPMISVSVMTFVIGIVTHMLKMAFTQSLVTLIAFGVGGIVYFALLIAIGGFEKKEVLQLFKN